jgi:hypothetical protein
LQNRKLRVLIATMAQLELLEDREDVDFAEEE